MPPSEKVSSGILQEAATAVGALQDVSKALQVPFLPAICGICSAILVIFQSAKAHKQEHLQLLKQVQELLWVVVDLSLGAESPDFLPQSVLYNLGNFARTLQKIHSLMDAEASSGRFRRLWLGTNTQQMEECKEEMRQCLKAFTMYSTVQATQQLGEIERDSQRRKEELLSIISDLSKLDSATLTSFPSRSVESIASLLPATPKVFNGRDNELKQIVSILVQDSPPRVAILGTGGIGKTALATSVLNLPEIVDMYQHRYFVPCDAASTCRDLIGIVASHIRAEPSKPGVVHTLMASSTTLLILDNFETPWEPSSEREDVEEFLSLLTDISQLALVITMRGVERPGRVRWTRPFLPPLGPLSNDAARQTFLDISDESEDNTDLDDLLPLTDNVPLALSLIANIASLEGSARVIVRWRNERTKILSEGYDRRSNLDISISMSLSSPRMTMFPGAKMLLQAISLLPDGISEANLMQCELPIANLDQCKLALLRTSLAYSDRDKRIKALAPVREYIRAVHPPEAGLVRPLTTHLYEVLMLWKSFRQIPTLESVPRIAANLGNLQSVLLWSIEQDEEGAAWQIRRILTLDSFLRASGRGISPLRAHLPRLFEHCEDHQARAEYISAAFESQHMYENQVLGDDLKRQGIQEFKLANDRVGEVQFYNVLAVYYLYNNGDPTTSEKYCELALTLSTENNDLTGKGKALMHLSEVYEYRGNARLGRNYARQARQAFIQNGYLLAQAHAMKAEIYSVFILGDFQYALALCAETKSVLAVCGMHTSELHSSITSAEAQIHLLKTDYQTARLLQMDILAKTSKGSEPMEHGYALLGLAAIDCATDVEEAAVRKNVDKARAVFTELKSPGSILNCDRVDAELQLRRGDVVEPATCFKKWLAVYRAEPNFALECLCKLADPDYGMHQPETTFAYAVVMFGYAKKAEIMPSVYLALRYIGDMFLRSGDEVTALHLYQTSLEGCAAMGIHKHQAECLTRIANICRKEGDVRRWIELLRQARTLFEKSCQARQVNNVERLLASVVL
ncbi:CTLH domain-containing protein [Favolaschia claudopus]|uniref:CTLH domain-containing protein n=1 Tax=Favolaschia claudopus TaxID=2862362 RepID=A0AAW0CN29_9AGAR